MFSQIVTSKIIYPTKVRLKLIIVIIYDTEYYPKVLNMAKKQ